METSRCPVKYKKLTLMPTTWRKARRLVKLKKGVFVKDKVLGVYLKLKYNPIGPNDIPNENQEMVLGIDKGSMFNGLTVYSKSNNLNIQFDLQLPIDKKLKGIMDKRKMYRRIRRYRLRHRKCRNQYRTGNKITNTSNYYFQHMRNMINRILYLYPITIVTIEDIKFNHYESDKGKSFSNIEIGKVRLVKFIKSIPNIILLNVRGKDTKNMRELLFPLRVKNKDKSIKDFNSHCIDSYSIALLGYMEVTGNREIIADLVSNNHNNIPSLVHLNDKVRLIERTPYKYRRELHRLKNKIRDARNYYRYSKGGIKVPFTHMSKLKKIRTKINDIKSNHGKIWNYMYTEVVQTYKKFITNYGGTIGKDGISKYWNGKYYEYYKISIV